MNQKGNCMSATRHRLQRNALSAALVSALVLTASTAYAQSTTTTNDDAKATDEKSQELDKIVVTGSRLKRDTFNSVSPVQVVTREETTMAGFNSTTAVLQSSKVTQGTAQINNAFGGFVTDGGPGANTVGLRGLGATRTLVLLNGRRVTPAGSRGSVGSADLNVLPNAMIDHIEVLKDGASSIYGSDAVAGVINIITKKKVDNFSIEGQYNFTADGGGDETKYAVVFGKTGDTSDFSGSFEHYNRSELTLGDRDWARCNRDYRDINATGNYGATDYVDPRTGTVRCYPITGTGSNGVTINTIGTSTATGVPAPGAAGTRFNRWRPNSAVTTGVVGFEGVNGAGVNANNVRDTFDPRMLNRSLISPATTDTLFLQGSKDLDVLGHGTLYAELLTNRRESQQTGYRQLSLDYIKGSPLIPSNLQFSTFSGPQPTSNGRNVGVRAFIGFGNDTSSQSVNYTRAVGGIRGDFFLTDWSYDLSVSQAWSSAKYTFESFLTDRLARSLDVVAAPGGGYVCRDTSGGCVAAPALTAAVIGGQLPQNWVDYVYQPVTGTTTYQETSANFNVMGPLFNMPAGAVQSAFGVEYRAASINDTPPLDSQNGNLYNLTSATPTRGSDYVAEAYGEVEVPLLRDAAFAKELSLNASARYTRYHSYGSDNTYKVALLYTPVSWLSLRATYGTSFRAPALFEQFLGATSGFLSSSTDPCNQFVADGTPRAVNCASEGLAPGYTPTSGVTVLTAGGAAQGLAAETSKNFTGGIVFQPELPKAFGDLSFAADYYKIKVENGVDRAGAGAILQRCYDDPQFRSGGGFCRFVNPRNPVSGALTVNDNYTNIATQIARGWDFTVRYTRDLGPGTFRATLEGTRFLSQAQNLFPDDPLDEYNGTLNNPKAVGSLDLAYSLKAWRVRYGIDWTDAQDSTELLELTPAQSLTYIAKVPSYVLHSASLQYRGDTWTVTGGVRNLFDKQPPIISSGLGYSRVGNSPLYSGYDFVGRTFFVNVAKSF